MIQLNEKFVDNEAYISSLISKAEKELIKRKDLYGRITKSTGVPIERYITTTGTSYFAGKEPKISVRREVDSTKAEIIKKLFDKTVNSEINKEEYEMMLDYINEYNDLATFMYEIAKDYFGTGACYWLTYETNANEIVYAKISSLQSVAFYDYSTPPQLIAGLRLFPETDEKGGQINVAVLTLKNERRYYRNSVKQPDEYHEDVDMREEVNWTLTPFYAVENPDKLSLFEPVINLVDSLEQVLKNERNTFQYNDDAKLKITGYSPENPILNDDGSYNKARIAEDEAVLSAKVFYTPEDGNIDWIIKNVNDTAIQNYTKQIVDFIFMLAMIPNMNDISFTNSDSGKAIEQKFFGLEQVLIEAEKLFKKELLRMYENITDRINIKKNTNYDFRDIKIDFTRNLPVSKSDVTQMWLQLRDLISDETIIDHLPLELDSKTELETKRNESEENMEQAIGKAMSFSKQDKIEEEETEEENPEEV